ncbi:MAG TPA: triple tyrosine motif-containing protein, partial [Chitinophagaceae bacterium]|nr:triple tyrosine motif-containing protein [Chitinophagaceae bacterium]
RSDYWIEARLAADADGNIWAGLTNQLLKFDPLKVQFEKNKPSITIDNILLNAKETNWLQWTDSMQGIMQLPYLPVLPYYKNNIDISYKGVSFSYASALEYSYRLMGSDSTWNVSPSNFVSMVNLSPGKYVFQVRARKSNSEWSEPTAFAFSIRKPYWQTMAFRLLIVFLISGTVYLLYRYRLNGVKKIMNMRLKISRDLHDEVGSTLSGIGIISEVAKQELENKKAYEVRESLDKISSNTEEILGKMSDIIWAINPQNESVSNMVNRLKAYARSVTSPVGIQLHFDSEKLVEKKDLTMQQLSSIYLICKEAINNAVKYSGCQNLRVTMQNEDHRFTVNISDDGKGFDSRKVFDGNGLKNIKGRAEEIKADLKIDSDYNNGTMIRLSVKIT